jgi:hypothetical protein
MAKRVGCVIDAKADAELAARYAAIPGPVRFVRAAAMLGVGRKRLEGALARTATPLKEKPEPKPAYVPQFVERDPQPLPAGHPISWTLLVGEGVPYPHA